MGDFNLPDIDWDIESVSQHRYSLGINQSLLQMSADCYFTQLVHSPTRDKTILDLFFTNRPMFINSCSIEPGISDHNILLVVICTKIPKPVSFDCKLYLWNRANFDEMRSKFADVSQEFFNQHTVDTPIEDLWHSLCSLLKSVLDEFVPSKIITGVSKNHGLTE